ncbi:Helix-turn-helix of DDE superfamily endonuclease [Streptomyces sp. AmelKG-D3]|nr:Helix-turn-helix of DDE superfamily endonuclease [Streptomyces sp. AmelKG-D3]
MWAPRPARRLVLTVNFFQPAAEVVRLGWQTGKAPGGWVFDQEIRLHQRLRVLVHPSGIDVSSSALRLLPAKLRQHRRELGTRWRRLSSGRQALLTLAHLRDSHPYAQLAAGFGVGTTTAYRYIASPRPSTSWPPSPPRLRRRPGRHRPRHSCRWTARCCRSTGSPPTGPSTAESTGSTGSTGGTCRSWPIPAAGCCGPRRLCPVPSTTSGPPVSTASSALSRTLTSSAGRTRSVEVPGVRSVSRAGAAGRPFPQGRRRSTGPTRRSAPWSSRPSPPSSPGGSSPACGARPPASRASFRPSPASI